MKGFGCSRPEAISLSERGIARMHPTAPKTAEASALAMMCPDFKKALEWIAFCALFVIYWNEAK